jgi:hypothetical protein
MDVKAYWNFLARICGHVWEVYHAGVNYLLEYLDIRARVKSQLTKLLGCGS